MWNAPTLFATRRSCALNQEEKASPSVKERRLEQLMNYLSDTELDPERPFGGDCTCKSIDYESDCPVCGPLIDPMKTERPPLDEIWDMVERAYFDGQITSRQRGFFLWAVRKSREVESPARYSRCIDGVEEL